MNSKKIEDLANETLQEIAESAGTLRVLDELLEDKQDKIGAHILWCLRNALRNIEASENKLAEIIHLAETSVYEDRGMREL